jgi:hypothetical protein
MSLRRYSAQCSRPRVSEWFRCGIAPQRVKLLAGVAVDPALSLLRKSARTLQLQFADIRECGRKAVLR